jgi:hypothetical protein
MIDGYKCNGFKRDGAGTAAAVLSDITGATTARYLPGISEQRNGSSTYFHEGIKNAITQTNASQSVTGAKRYDAFGLQVASTGTWKSPFAYGGPWGYQEDGDAYGLKLLGQLRRCAAQLGIMLVKLQPSSKPASERQPDQANFGGNHDYDPCRRSSLLRAVRLFCR